MTTKKPKNEIPIKVYVVPRGKVLAVVDSSLEVEKWSDGWSYKNTMTFDRIDEPLPPNPPK